MTLMCQTQRPRLAQRLSILHQDQHFFKNGTEHPVPESLPQEAESCPFFTVYKHEVVLAPDVMPASSVSFKNAMWVGHDKAMSIQDLFETGYKKIKVVWKISQTTQLGTCYTSCPSYLSPH